MDVGAGWKGQLREVIGTSVIASTILKRILAYWSVVAEPEILDCAGL